MTDLAALQERIGAVIDRWYHLGLIRFNSRDDGGDDLILRDELVKAALAPTPPDAPERLAALLDVADLCDDFARRGIQPGPANLRDWAKSIRLAANVRVAAPPSEDAAPLPDPASRELREAAQAVCDASGTGSSRGAANRRSGWSRPSTLSAPSSGPSRETRRRIAALVPPSESLTGELT